MRKCGRARAAFVCALTEMEVNLQLSVFILLIHVSLATRQKMTVMKGQTLRLNCPLTKQSQGGDVEWKNPDVVRNKRYSLHKLSDSEYSVQISDVTFSDGGHYTCSHYVHHAIDKTVEVIVLDRPKIQFTKDDNKTVIKCTAAGNSQYPKIYWRLKNGPKFNHVAQTLQEDKKFVSIEILNIQHSEKVVTVKCIVHHPTLKEDLIDFVKIRPRGTKYRRTTTTISPQSTPAPKTARDLTTAQVITGNAPLTEGKTVTTESSSATSPFSSTDSSTTRTTRDLTTAQVITGNAPLTEGKTVTTESSSATSPFSSTGWTSVAVATEEIGSFNHTEGNSTGNGSDFEKREGNNKNISLLVFLVTCLIFGLLVVVIFIGIKLRRAHITWKKENDESDTSEESSKSKSSLEEKNIQAQRRRAFTQYVVQEPTVITSVSNPAAMTSTEDTATAQPTQAQLPAQLPAENTASSRVKETAL